MLIFVPVEEYTPLFVSGRDCQGVLKLFMRNILDIMFVLKISLQKVVFIEEPSKKCLYLHILDFFLFSCVSITIPKVGKVSLFRTCYLLKY